MPRQRVKFEVEVDLDPMPGRFHTAESARTAIRNILGYQIKHYNPSVEFVGPVEGKKNDVQNY